MVGSRLGVLVRILILTVVAVASQEAAAAAQDVSSCIIRRCAGDTCFSVDARRCVNPNPRTVEGVCTFATPVPGCENPDTDGDGLADFWEDAGAIDINCDGVYDSNDVFLPGANNSVKDVYVSLSAMQSAPNEAPGVHFPSADAINTVVEAFAGSHLKTDVQHCDANSSCTAAGFACAADDHVCLPACATDADCGGTTDGGRCVDGVCRSRRLHVDPWISLVPHSDVVSFGPVNEACITGGSSSDPSKAVNFYDIKNGNFDPKQSIFKRYGVFGHFNTCDSPETCAVCQSPIAGLPNAFGTSGLAEIPGNDFVVTLAGFPGFTEVSTTVMKQRESGALMHELGHTLGLNHSGPGSALPGSNTPPNHVSVMNYWYNFGIPTTDTPGAVTLSGNMAFDFSHAELGHLDEMSLDESTGVSPGLHPPYDKYLVRYFSPTVNGATRYGSTYPGTPIDWNGNGIIEANVTVDLNNNGGATDFFTSTEEWSTLAYAFQCSWSFADGAAAPSPYPATPELNQQMLQDMGLSSPPPLVAPRLDVGKECIDVSSNGVVPTTLFGSSSLNVTSINQSSVRLNNAVAISMSIQDKDGDGYLDLSGRFKSNQIQLAPNSTKATLFGRLTSGQEFQAYDTVKIVTGSISQCK